MSGDEVLISAENGLARIRLNRPDALNALTLSMVRRMTEALLAWRARDDVRIVLLDHREGRGFCAGGDIRALYESVKGDGQLARDFFTEEYRLNTLIKTYPKPFVALMDGVTMGGGVGVSVHGSHRVVTENTIFAMPETGIGLFPDVGGTWFLPRLPGEVGAFMALTGARLKAADCVKVGIATHYAPADLLDVIRAQVGEAALSRDPAAALAQELAEFSEQAGEAPLLAHKDAINKSFAHNRVEDVIAALAADGSDWARAQSAAIAGKAPVSLKVALRQMREGRSLATFEDAMRIEQRLARRIVFAHDFSEGVRALVIAKDNAPRWAPPRLEDVSDEMIDALFSPLDAGDELRFLD